MDLTYIPTEDEINKKNNIIKLLYNGTYLKYPINDPHLTYLENRKRKVYDTNISTPTSTQQSQCRIKRIFSKTKQISNCNSAREKIKYCVDWGNGLRDIRPVSVEDIMKYINNDQELFYSLMCDDDLPEYGNGLKKATNKS